MPDARIVAAAIAALALAAYHSQQPAQDQNIAIDENVDINAVGNADIETLPPDEGAGTSDNEVVNDFNSI